MPKKYYIIGGAILVLLVILGLVFSSGSKGPKQSGEQINLIWWKTFEDNESVADLISQFQSFNKNVTVTFVKKNAEDYEAELVDAIASGRTPDIFSIHNDWLAKHIDKLSPAPEKLINFRLYKETFVDAVSGDFIKDGKIYAIPLSVDALALYYNKDILNSAGVTTVPKTWDEVVAAVYKITKQTQPGIFDRSGIALGTSQNINRAVDIVLMLMLQNGTVFYADDLNSVRFDAQQNLPGGEIFNPGAMALEFYTQFAQAAKKTYTWNTRSDQSVDAFVAGRLGLMLSYSYMRPVIQSRGPALNWAVTDLPQIGGNFLKANYANYWGEAVSKFSANQELAWSFLNFISQKESLQGYYAKHPLPSSRRDILAQQQEDENLGPFANGALIAKSVYKKDVGKFEGIFGRMIDDVILRNFKPQDAIKNGAAQVNVFLRE